MARISNRDLKPVFEAVEVWRENCLINDRSVFSSESLWTAGNITELHRYFVEAPIEGSEATFYEKFQEQLTPAIQETKRLAAEMLWVMFLFPSNVRHATKVQGVRRVWSWSGASLPESHPMLGAALGTGVGSGGMGYNNFRWRELVFLIDAMTAFKKVDISKRAELLGDPWEFGNWLDAIEGANRRQLRHMLLFLLFPDHYETISSENHKVLLLKRFSSSVPVERINELVRPSDSTLVRQDKELFAVREALSKETPDPINFYNPPWREKWLPDRTPPELPQDAPTGKRYWIEKCLVRGRPDREAGPDALGVSLWSPQRDKRGADIYATMRDVNVGDVVLHLIDNEGITGISIVAGPRDESFIGLKGTDWAGVPCYRIPLRDFVVLAPPLPREAFFGPPELQARLSQGLEGAHKLFYNNRLELNQGAYLTEAPPFLLSVLAEAYRAIGGDAIPHLPPGLATATQLKAEQDLTPYSIDDAIADLFIGRVAFDSMLALFRAKRNLILQGPPGCGKSFMAMRLAYVLLGAKDKSRIETVQFHQSYSYEDFIQGFRPVDGGGFQRQDGIFFRFCDRALKDPARPYVFVIDEINRGNLSKIFGEAMLLIESDKRSPEWSVSLTYGDDKSAKFYVPPNVYILGMMNTADRSLAMVDYALRRRFAFTHLGPAFDQPAFSSHLETLGVPAELVDHIKRRVGALNDAIEKDTDLGAGFLIGHSFFCPPATVSATHAAWYQRVIESEIKPLLKEYWFDKKPSQITDAVDALRFGAIS